MTENNEKQAELLPCPFCGEGDAEAQYDGSGDWYVMCLDCLSTGPYRNTNDDATHEWNRRAALAQQPQGEAVAGQSAEPVALTEAGSEHMLHCFQLSGLTPTHANRNAFRLGYNACFHADEIATPPAATGAQGLTREALYEAIHGALMEHGLNYTEDTGSGEKFPLIDKLCAPDDETIQTGKDEVAILAEAILDVIPGGLAQSAPRADHSGEGAEMVATGKQSLKVDTSASAGQAEPVAWMTPSDWAKEPLATCYKSVANAWRYDNRQVTPLYAAPQPAAVPEGWKIVPEFPTPGILAAIYRNERDSKRAWRDALAAAPQPPAPTTTATPAAGEGEHE